MKIIQKGTKVRTFFSKSRKILLIIDICMNTQRWQQTQQKQSQQHYTKGASKIKVKIEIEERDKGMK